MRLLSFRLGFWGVAGIDHFGKGPSSSEVSKISDGEVMPKHYATAVWQLELPDGWNVRDAGGQTLVTFYRPDGVGMLSVHVIDQPYSAKLSHHQPFTAGMSGHTSGGGTYGTSYSKTWILNCRGMNLLVRYSCAAKNVDVELAEVESIVRSLSVLQQFN